MDELDEFLYEPPEIGTVLYMTGLPGGGSTIYDRSPYGSHGTIVGATWVREGGLWGLSYDGTNDYVEATCPQLNFTSEDFSIVARVYLALDAVWRDLLCRGAESATGYQLKSYGGNNFDIFFQTNQPTAQYTYLAAPLVANTWYTVGITRIGAAVKIYINGADATGTTGTHGNPVTNTNSLKIGIDNDKVTAPLKGQMPYLHIVNYALTAGQHLQANDKLNRFFRI